MDKQHPDITEAPLFRFEALAADVGEFAPRSADEIESWLDKEAAFWQWLRVPINNEQPYKPMRAKQFHLEEEIRQFLAAFKKSPESHPDAIEQIRQRIQTRYLTGLAIHSSSPRASFIANIASRDPLLAAIVGFVLTGSDPPAFDRRGVTATALAAAYTHGLTTSPKNFDEPMRAAIRDIEKDRERLVRAAGEANDEWNAQREKITALHAQQRDAFDVVQARRESEFKVLVETHTTKVDQIRDALKKDMSLKAAVTYFSDKASSHSRKVGWFTVAATAVAGGVVWGAFAVAASVFKEAAQPSPVQIGLTLVCGFLVLWLLRLLVRILLSNLHLATDLRNRATLVQTYLALLADGGGGLSDKDRALIVGIVFRPVNDGLVRDDGAPPTAFSALQDMVAGGRK